MFFHKRRACKCLSIPIEPKCIKTCTELVLRTATFDEMTLILGLDYGLAEVISNAYKSRYRVSSFRALEHRLTSRQVETLLEKFSHINQFQLNHFKKSQVERNKIIEEIRRRGFGSDKGEWTFV